jgi:hypothetical protein
MNRRRKYVFLGYNRMSKEFDLSSGSEIIVRPVKFNQDNISDVINAYYKECPSNQLLAVFYRTWFDWISLNAISARLHVEKEKFKDLFNGSLVLTGQNYDHLRRYKVNLMDVANIELYPITYDGFKLNGVSAWHWCTPWGVSYNQKGNVAGAVRCAAFISVLNELLNGLKEDKQDLFLV